jgi:hypothetical protein
LRPGTQVRLGAQPARRERFPSRDGQHPDPGNEPAKIGKKVALG